jgi:toxin CcdB
MAHCRVYRNPSVPNRQRVPYLLDVQSDLYDTFRTRIAVPLVNAEYLRKQVPRLQPLFNIEGRSVVMSTTDLAVVPATALREMVADLSNRRGDIIAALDLLFTGS